MCVCALGGVFATTAGAEVLRLESVVHQVSASGPGRLSIHETGEAYVSGTGAQVVRAFSPRFTLTDPRAEFRDARVEVERPTVAFRNAFAIRDDNATVGSNRYQLDFVALPDTADPSTVSWEVVGDENRTIFRGLVVEVRAPPRTQVRCVTSGAADNANCQVRLSETEPGHASIRYSGEFPIAASLSIVLVFAEGTSVTTAAPTTDGGSSGTSSVVTVLLIVGIVIPIAAMVIGLTRRRRRSVTDE